MDAKIKSGIKKATLGVRIIRANGKVENLGIVCGGNIMQKIKSKYKRMYYAVKAKAKKLYEKIKKYLIKLYEKVKVYING